MNLKVKRLLYDTGIFALGNLGSKLILFFMVPLYTSYLSKAEYGISDLISTLTELLVPFASLVILDAVQRFALSKDESKEDVLLSGLFVSTLGGLSLLFITPLFGYYHTLSPWKWFLSVYVILTVYGNVEKNYLKAKDKNTLFAVLSILQTAALALCNVFFICTKRLGVVGYLLSTCVSCLVPVIGPFIFGGLLSDLNKARLNISLTIRMVCFSAPLILNNISWWAIHSFDKVLLELILGAETLGIYSVATKMPSLVNVFTSIFSQAWGISSVREFESENDKNYYSHVLRALVFFVFGITILFVCIMKRLLSVYVGASFQDAWRYTPMLLTGAALNSIASFYGCMYGALKRSVNNMVTTAVSSAVCLILTISLVPSLGIWGAVLGTYAAYFTLLILRVLDLKRYIDINYGGWRLWCCVMIITLHAGLISIDVPKPNIINLLIILSFLYCNFDVVLFWHRSLIRR